MNFKKIICRLACIVKIPEAYMYFRKRILGNHIVIFVYHRVCPEKGNSSVANICPEEFEKQIRYLKEKFKIYSLEKLINVLENNQKNKKESENIAVITFDDGYKDNYLYAYPILKKYKIPATIFLISNYIGKDKLFWWDKIEYIIYHTKKGKINIPNFGKFLITNKKKKFYCILFLLKKFKRMSNNLRDKHISELQNICRVRIPAGLEKKMILSWDEIREMKDNGITLGVHTATHPNLTNICLAEAEKEIINSKKMIENQLKTDATLFTYPYGSKLSYNNEIIKLIKNIGFKGAVTTNYGLVNKYNIDSIYSLPKIWVSNYYSRFKIEVSGIFSDFNFI